MAPTSLDAVARHVRSLIPSQPPGGQTDGELLRAFAIRNDQAAFAALVRRHGPLVLAVCRRVLHQMEDAEDAFQATFLVLARQAAALGPKDSLAGWLHGVSYRIALNARRAAVRRHRHERQAQSMHPTNPAWEAAWREVQLLLDEEIRRLPEKYREPFVLCCLHSHSCSEAARRLGVKEGTVWSRLAEARKRLQKRLSHRGVALTAVLGTAALAADRATAHVPRSLAASTVQAALSASTGAVSERIAMLVQTMTKPLVLTRAKLGAMLVLAASALAGMAGWCAYPEPPAERPPAPQATSLASPPGKNQNPRTDLHGDPLPPGALARFGTIKQRPGAWELVVTPDGKTVVAYGDRVLRLYDAVTGELRRTHQLPGMRGIFPTLSPDGRFLAMDESFGPLSVWDTASGKSIYASEEKLDSYFHFPFCFSFDSRLLAAVNLAKVCRLLDIKTGKCRDLAKLSEIPTALAFSRDGKRLALSLNDRTLVCLDTATGKQLWRIQSERSQGMTFAASDSVLALSQLEGDSGLMLLDAMTGKPLGRDRLPPAEGRCWNCVAVGDTLALLLNERTLIWDVKAARERASLKEMGASYGVCRRLALTPDGKSVFTLGSLLERWDAASGERQFADTRSLGHTSPIAALAYSPDGQRVATAAHEKSAAIHIWDAKSSRLLLTLRGHGDFPLAFLRFTPDGKHLLAAGPDSTVCVWDIAAGKEVRRWSLRDSEEKAFRYLAGLRLSDDGKTLVTLLLDPHNGALNGLGGTVSIWDVATGKRLFQRLGVKPLFNAAISPDGRRLGLEGGDIYDLAEGTNRWTFRPDDRESHFGKLTFSPDGMLAAAELRKRTVRNRHDKERVLELQVWELASGRRMARLELDEEMEDGLRFAFTSDSRRLLMIGPETFRSWDVLTGREVFRHRVPEHLLGAWSSPFALTPDGRALLTSSTDTTALLWELSPADRADAAPLKDKQREALWAGLAAEDPLRARAAHFALAARPEVAVSLARDRLRPAKPVFAEDVRRWIADLDSPHFEKRQQASRHLAEHGRQVESALREALDKKPSLEARVRIKGLLEDARTPRGEELRGVRAVYLLKRIGTPEAMRVVATLAEGDPRAWLSQEARGRTAPYDRH